MADLVGDLTFTRAEAPPAERPTRAMKQQTKVERSLRRIGALPAAPRGKPSAIHDAQPAKQKPTKCIIATLTKQGILINLADILKYINMCMYMKLQERLTHIHLATNGREVVKQHTIRLFRIHTIASANGQTRRLFACSRFCGITRLLRETCSAYNLQLKVENKILPGAVIPAARAECTIVLTENQQLVLDYLMTNIYSETRQNTGGSGCVFVMETGHGKSYIAAKLISKLRKKTLLVVPSEPILEGWVGIFTKMFPRLQVGKYYGREKSDGDVVIAIINSALSNSFTVNDTTMEWSAYMNRFGFVVYDEIHNYPTSGRQEIFWRCGARCLLGLTATPDERADEMDVVYTKHIGPLVNAPDIPGYNVEEVQWQGRVRVILYHGHPDFIKRITGYNGVTNTTGMYKQFCADPYRNLLVLEEIKAMQADGLDVFCFSEHREYLEYLYSLLSVAGMLVQAPELDGGKGKVCKLMGGSTPEDLNQANKSQIILVTYAYAKEGISIVKMNAMIFTTPRRRKMKQILGRILRRGGDPSVVRRIVDITDIDTPLRSQLNTRKQEYARRGFPVEEEGVSWKKYEKQVK